MSHNGREIQDSPQTKIILLVECKQHGVIENNFLLLCLTGVAGEPLELDM